MIDLEPVTLESRHVRLEPLGREHRADLARAALDPDLWQWTLTRIHSMADFDEYFSTALEWREAGTAIPFAIVDRSTGHGVGIADPNEILKGAMVAK